MGTIVFTDGAPVTAVVTLPTITPFTAGAVIELARLWLSDPDSGSIQNQTGAEPRWDDDSMLQYVNNAIDKINNRYPDLGLTDPTTFTPQPHIASDGDTISYPQNVFEPMAHYLCWAATTEDDSDKANAEKADKHKTEWLAFYGKET